MNKIKDMLHDKRGNAMLYAMAIATLFLLILIVITKGLQTREMLSHIQTTAEQVLDKYTATQGRKAADSFKNGTNYTIKLDEDQYIKQLQDALGIGSDNIGESNGKIRVILSDITLKYTATKEIDSTVTMHVTLPLYWDNIKTNTVEGTITVRSKYECKQ